MTSWNRAELRILAELRKEIDTDVDDNTFCRVLHERLRAAGIHLSYDAVFRRTVHKLNKWEPAEIESLRTLLKMHPDMPVYRLVRKYQEFFKVNGRTVDSLITAARRYALPQRTFSQRGHSTRGVMEQSQRLATALAEEISMPPPRFGGDDESDVADAIAALTTMRDTPASPSGVGDESPPGTTDDDDEERDHEDTVTEKDSTKNPIETDDSMEESETDYATEDSETDDGTEDSETDEDPLETDADTITAPVPDKNRERWVRPRGRYQEHRCRRCIRGHRKCVPCTGRNAGTGCAEASCRRCDRCCKKPSSPDCDAKFIGFWVPVEQEGEKALAELPESAADDRSASVEEDDPIKPGAPTLSEIEDFFASSDEAANLINESTSEDVIEDLEESTGEDVIEDLEESTSEDALEDLVDDFFDSNDLHPVSDFFASSDDDEKKKRDVPRVDKSDDRAKKHGADADKIELAKEGVRKPARKRPSARKSAIGGAEGERFMDEVRRLDQPEPHEDPVLIMDVVIEGRIAPLEVMAKCPTRSCGIEIFFPRNAEFVRCPMCHAEYSAALVKIAELAPAV